jgi:Fe2+ or Zn2+ uptake regulation protein
MHTLSDQQLSPTLVVKSLLANGFPEFSFSDLLQEFKRHFPTQSTKTVYQSLYRVVDRFVKKGYLVRQNTPDGNLVFQQANVLRELDVGTSKAFEIHSAPALKEQLRDELARAERELWVSSSAADQCQQKMQAYPQLRQKLSKMHMEYKEKSLSKLGEVEVLRRLLIECEQL